jgi:hypothetical protein
MFIFEIAFTPAYGLVFFLGGGEFGEGPFEDIFS